MYGWKRAEKARIVFTEAWALASAGRSPKFIKTWSRLNVIGIVWCVGTPINAPCRMDQFRALTWFLPHNYLSGWSSCTIASRFFAVFGYFVETYTMSFVDLFSMDHFSRSIRLHPTLSCHDSDFPRSSFHMLEFGIPRSSLECAGFGHNMFEEHVVSSSTPWIDNLLVTSRRRSSVIENKVYGCNW